MCLVLWGWVCAQGLFFFSTFEEVKTNSRLCCLLDCFHLLMSEKSTYHSRTRKSHVSVGALVFHYLALWVSDQSPE